MTRVLGALAFVLLTIGAPVMGSAVAQHGIHPTDGVARASCTGPRERKVRPKIVNGWRASAEHWPWFVALRLHNEAKQQTQYICGGALIAPRWILTAAHCFDEFDGPTLVASDNSHKATSKTSRLERYVGADLGFDGPARLQVQFAPQDLKSLQPSNLGEVERVVIHPDYAGPDTVETHGNDVALVQLAIPRSGPFSRLSPVLPSDPPTPPGNILMTAGFGTTKEGQKAILFKGDKEDFTAGAANLGEVDLPTIDTSTCRSVYGAKAIGDGQICAGYPTGQKDSCQGDSGGPLVAFDDQRCPYQVGIVSWGEGCAKANAYGVYSRVSHFFPWIAQIVQEPLISVSPQQAAANIDPEIRKELSQSIVSEINTMLGQSAARISMRLFRYIDRKVIADNVLRLNERYYVEVASSATGRLILIDVDAAGHVTQIFPNEHVSSDVASVIEKGRQVVIPGPGYAFDWFRAGDPRGKGKLQAIVVPPAFPYSALVGSPLRMSKHTSLKPEAAPLSYLSTLLDQIHVASRSAAEGGLSLAGWAYATIDYEIR